VDDDGHQLRFFDSRPCTNRTDWTTDGLAANIYRLCDSAQTSAVLIRRLSEQRGTEILMHEFEAAIDSLIEAKVVLPLGGKLLAVGVCPNHC